ncbi:methionyl-tRNA formyltransferase [Treponema socranskii]|uniref:methionyl-tRNA formyltransferase n=1 Tax=Treponema socranskii TaxID=53419 RepID=UPI003D8B500C
MLKILHIGYFADGKWGHNAFHKLNADDSLIIDFVCVRNDNRDPVLVKFAEANGIDVLFTPNINSDEFLEKLEAYKSDLFVSMSFNQIFKEKIRNLPPLSIINCHAGKLPYYRGRNILNWTLINDEKEFGITVHYVDSGIDTGDIILQKTYKITDADDYKTLLETAYTECPALLYDAIKQIQNGTAQRINQNSISPHGLYCGSRRVGDEILDWNQTSREVFNFIRAITIPGPCACSYTQNGIVKFIRAEEIKDAPVYTGVVGQVLIKAKDFILVKTKDSYIKIIEYEGTIKVGDRFKIAP